jgi:ribosomal protein S18 acetylase RimI-like enzyme
MRLLQTSIKEASLTDIQKVLPFVHSYIVDFYKWNDPSIEKLEKHLIRIVNNMNSGRIFIQEEDQAGQVTGFAILYFTYNTLEAEKTVTLHDLFIQPRLRREGLGEELMKHVIDFSKNNGFVMMDWKTATDNIIAQSLYNKLGGNNINNDFINYVLEL